MTLNLVIRIAGSDDTIERASDVRAAINDTLADLTSRGVIHDDDGWNWQI